MKNVWIKVGPALDYKKTCSPKMGRYAKLLKSQLKKLHYNVLNNVTTCILCFIYLFFNLRDL